MAPWIRALPDHRSLRPKTADGRNPDVFEATWLRGQAVGEARSDPVLRAQVGRRRMSGERSGCIRK